MNKQNIPANENKIEELLTKIQPVPSEHFHQKMNQAVWRVEQEKGIEMTARNRRVKLAVAVTIVFLITIFVATPQGRACPKHSAILQPYGERPIAPPALATNTFSNSNDLCPDIKHRERRGAGWV